MDRLYTSNVSMSSGNIQCRIGKLIFAVNLTLKVFRSTVANADIGKSKSFLHKLFDTYLDYYMLMKFEQNRMIQTT